MKIRGLRGVRYDMELPLGGRSTLIYGENGSGKSTVSDVIEWFYTDKVDHLAVEEIGRKGYEALRNIFLANDDSGSLKLEFTDTKLNDEKTIGIHKKTLKSAHTNSVEEFANYLIETQKENLILRYRELITFVLSSKTDKLKTLSSIIGYSQITNTRAVLLSVLNRLRREIKTGNFDNQISYQQSQIIEQFGQNVISDEQFIKAVTALVKPFALVINIKELKDVNEVLRKIKTPDDSAAVKQEAFLSKVQEKLVNLPAHLDVLEEQYQEYKEQFDGLVSDIEKLKNLALDKLLTAGKELLSKGGYSDDNCPLCLTDKNRDELLADIEFRIAELEEIKKEKARLRTAKQNLKDQVEKTNRLLHGLYDDVQIQIEENKEHKINIHALIQGVEKYKEQLMIEVSGGNKLPDAETLKIGRDVISTINEDSGKQLKAIKESREKDSKADVYSKIKISGHAYAEIKRLKDIKSVYETQRDTLEVIYTRFLDTQRTALEAFLTRFSAKIDEIYQFMNPGERVDNIKLVSITKDDELSGITIQFDFLDSKEVTPPQKYLSESHINCLGIAFFLTSIEAFNKRNKFIVLDDVISSFDASHRKRFADLLIEKYDEYQIILLTHDKSWFGIVKNLVRGKNWDINTIKYSETKGAYIDEAPQTLKQRIEDKIGAGDKISLGNDVRKYLEHVLKEIAFNLEVKLPFRFNEINEERMAYELITELKATLKKRKCSELLSENVLDRLLGSLFVGNKDSHDNECEPDFGDIKAFWHDVCEFENLFFCSKCKSLLSLKNYDKVNKKIRCNKGELEYTWKN
jgi:energy-coupling factor transporter ATP-binding protein EcfA2